MVEYVPAVIKVPGSKENAYANSGYGVAEPIDYALELMTKKRNQKSIGTRCGSIPDTVAISQINCPLARPVPF